MQRELAATVEQRKKLNVEESLRREREMESLEDKQEGGTMTKQQSWSVVLGMLVNYSGKLTGDHVTKLKGMKQLIKNLAEEQ